ncbi:hypothetical protein [Aliiroseovarius sp. S253]|uniref:hypothetical protein n=1 Tax=Aliiroseovarius sp. S253 TaxID=3415133 RepID=UPI003C7C3E21
MRYIPLSTQLARLSRLGVLSCALILCTSLAQAQMAGHGHMHGADGTGHDEVTMPGLRGANATPEESQELAVLFRNFPTLERSVENLPNGIRTVTRSTEPEVMEVLVSHVVGMLDRVERKDDPQILIQSPTLNVFFERAEHIATEFNVTDAGIEVIQTSDDPVVVEALQLHAEEVSAMAAQGMHAVHMMMMQRARN